MGWLFVLVKWLFSLRKLLCCVSFCWLSRVLSSKEYVCLYEGCDFRFYSEIEGSHAFCTLLLFMCCIWCLMCSGSSSHVECILYFGMLCLSAQRMMFVKMVCSVNICWWLNITKKQAHCL